MNKKQWVIDYALITSFVWGMYLCWLIPFQLFLIGLTWEQFIDWLVYGTMLELIFTYPIAKSVAKYSPKITKWVKSNV
jgi:hypothetical protein